MVDRMDRFFADARARRLKVLLLVSGTPCWASAAPADVRGDCSTATQRNAAQAYPPADPQDYARFAAFVAARYAKDLQAFEVWNEPDQRNELYFAAPTSRTLRRAAEGLLPGGQGGRPGVPVLGGASWAPTARS